jgi:hypothetical protein
MLEAQQVACSSTSTSSEEAAADATSSMSLFN